jgi:hypothetical protein
VAVDRYALLEAARRLDWRFLLPDPELGRVACVGRPDPALVAALRALAGSLTVADAAGEPEAYPVVVAAVPTRAELHLAVRLVRPGGWLYVERQGPLAGRGRSWPASAQRAVLARHGLDQIAEHWHWPNFAASKWIVSLGDPAAVRYALRRHRGGARARVLRRLGLLLPTRLLAAVVPCTSIVAHLPAGARETA